MLIFAAHHAPVSSGNVLLHPPIARDMARYSLFAWQRAVSTPYSLDAALARFSLSAFGPLRSELDGFATNAHEWSRLRFYLTGKHEISSHTLERPKRVPLLGAMR